MSSGTGGHLWPALVLARGVRDAGRESVLLTEGRAVENELLARARAAASAVETVPVGGRGVLQAIGLARATGLARRSLRKHDVDLVVSTGGRTSVAVGCAAWSLGIPLVLLEQNAVPGRANRLLSRIARRVYLGLPTRWPLRRAVLTGTPLRPDFGSISREAARRSLGLDPDRPVVLVTGGSQGAAVLNELAPAALGALGMPLQIVHLTGVGNAEDVGARYADGPDVGATVVVRPIAIDMARLQAAADLVVCRGGGCTVAELAASGRPAVIVPYPHHKDRQQLHNARVLADAGAAIVIEQNELSAGHLADCLRRLLRDRELLEAMGERARSALPCGARESILEDLARVGSWN